MSARNLPWSLLALVLALSACGRSQPVATPDAASGIPRCGGAPTQSADLRPVEAGYVAPSSGLTTTGRRLAAVGRQTVVGNFPTGGSLTPDGRYYWAVSAGHGINDVYVVEVGSGEVVQVLPLPGSYGQMAFAPDGRRAYVSGLSKGSSQPAGPTLGDEGDVIHVFDVDPAKGCASEQTPIVLPATRGGSGRLNSLPPEPDNPNFPVGMAVTPDGAALVVALNNSDRAAIISPADGAVDLVDVGRYPFGVGIERSGRYAYVTSEGDGTLTKIDLNSRSVVATVGVGGARGDAYAHPQAVLADPFADRLFVAVTNRDLIAVVDTRTDSVARYIDVGRGEGIGTSPVALALSGDAKTLFAAMSGENSVVAIALDDRPQIGVAAFDVIGRLPTADYATDVEVTADGKSLVWLAAKGYGAGPNPEYGVSFANSEAAPYGSYVVDKLLGRVGMLPMPQDDEWRDLALLVDQAVRPENAVAPPADTPLHGACGAAGCAPSDRIKYVFYIVRENRTYDQVFGSDPRGNGDPALQVLEDNGVDHPGAGTTPNAHKLSREFVLLDNFYCNSEVSVDGHIITAGAYAIDYAQKSLHADYSGRDRPYDLGIFPISFPPNHFLFDEAARRGIRFHNYGEASGGTLPIFAADGRSTYAQVLASTDILSYPNNLFSGCLSDDLPANPNNLQCTFDSGLGAPPPLAQSRIDAFRLRFALQTATCTPATIGTPACGVPQFNYLIMPNDHTNGTRAGNLSPLAMIADNDLAVGQFLDIVSHSPIWPLSVVFVVEDDSQDGADHVDAHRSVALVAGPQVRRGGAVVSTRYDQLSVIRTIELILGMQPLSLFDAMATPMYDVFTPAADVTPYEAVMPEQNIQELNTAQAANAALSKAMPYEMLDLIPQSINDRILWQAVFGADAEPPAPGPNGSLAEKARARAAMKLYREFGHEPAKAAREIRSHLLATTSADRD